MTTTAVSTEPGAFPEAAPPAEQWQFVLRTAVAAPSLRNTQPWRFCLEGGTLTLQADRTRQLTALDPRGRDLLMSCGAALYHLRLALRCAGRRDEVRLWPRPEEPDTLAAIRIGGPAPLAAEDELLGSAVALRHTFRGVLAERRPAPELVAALRAAARSEGVWLHTVTHERARRDLAVLIAEGDTLDLANAAFQQEAARWMVSPWRTFATARGGATEPADLAAGSPLLAVLETEEDGPAAWLAAGQALARVLLRAAAAGVQASFLNQPLHHEELRARLRGVIGGSDTPQALLRLGYAPALEPSSRRRVDEVLTVVASG